MFSISGPMRYVRYDSSKHVRKIIQGQSELNASGDLGGNKNVSHPVSGQLDGRRSVHSADRRRVSRRIRREPILAEFRSGVNRRRRHLRESDTIVHVSIKI